MDPVLVVISLVLPLLVSFAKQSGWDDRINHAIALAVYILWAFGYTFYYNGFTDLKLFLVNFATTLVVGTVTYQMILKPFGIDDALTHATTLPGQHAPEEDVVIEG